MKDSFRKALLNIIKHGDTDIFPFPFERYLFEDKIEETIKILCKYHSNLEEAISKSPPLTIVQLCQVGYFGFRQGTMIEPFWNAYFLGLIISIADEIEKKRINEEDKKVYSYRYQWQKSKSSLFKELNWIDYKKQCIEYSNNYAFVLQTDISSFYPRINHHKLENEIIRVTTEDTKKRIMILLSQFSGTISYGLPVGGPASRILSELALNQTDLHLKTRGIEFCRYVDDYTIFCKDESEAYKTLVLLSEKLSNDQLILQKEKTKIMSSQEYREIHKFLDPKPSEEAIDDEQKLLNISIRFDPYSDTAIEDYEDLKEAIREIDIISILSREVNKTRIDQTITKQAVKSIKVLPLESQTKAIKILIDHDNLITLSPVFTTIIRAIRGVYEDLTDEAKDIIDDSLLGLFKTQNYLTKIEINLNYIIQIFSLRYSPEKETLLISLFENETSHLLRRQIIVTMSNWNRYHWLVDIKNKFSSFTTWEKRAIVYASYFLNDEGEKWRDQNIKFFTTEEKLVNDWCLDRFKSGNLILV